MSRIDGRALGLVLLLAAALWIALVAPLASRLPEDYQTQLYFDSVARARETPTGKWKRIVLIGRRLDTTLLSTPGRSIIQSDAYWALPSGELYFENAGVYAVDRATRENVPGLGDVDRRGLFLFPPGLAQGSHLLWDSQLVGPRQMQFETVDEVDGMTVHRYTFRVRGLDETQGYSHLPDVPVRYRARTDSEGTLSIEPASGVLVDYTEHGQSSFVTPQGRIAGAFFEWDARFTEQTRLAQRQRARDMRRQGWVMQTLIPRALALVGLALLLRGAVRARRTT